MRKQSQKIHSDPTDTELSQYPFPPFLINIRSLSTGFLRAWHNILRVILVELLRVPHRLALTYRKHDRRQSVVVYRVLLSLVYS